MASLGPVGQNLVILRLDSQRLDTHLEVDPSDPSKLVIAAGKEVLSPNALTLVFKTLQQANCNGGMPKIEHEALETKYSLKQIRVKNREAFRTKHFPGYATYEVKNESRVQTQLRLIFEAEVSGDWFEMSKGGEIVKNISIKGGATYLVRYYKDESVQPEIDRHKHAYLSRIAREKTSPQLIALLKKYSTQITQFLEKAGDVEL